ncbi:unnamed protein product [Soboliphyme baturini]|uniref:WD_REPEATS_REGION domain-containing protein n=1 Tax=Soboliphyme baturini TaxID=241478 RepID=A0A183IGR8_9BILA|nr:unnamed protein product [Soboliphyme baturini]
MGVEEVNGAADVSKETPATRDTLDDASAVHRAKLDVANTGADQTFTPRWDYCDSSDEEDLRNTIGNVRIGWYDGFGHVGYDWSGKKILKPAQKSEIDKFLETLEDPNYCAITTLTMFYRRKVTDRQTGRDVVLNDHDVQVIRNISHGRFPVPGYNPYQVEKLAKAIQSGRIKPKVEKTTVKKHEFYDLWTGETQLTRNQQARMKMAIPAPKMHLPGHEESYNPPTEYLFTETEIEKWKKSEPEERKLDFIPLSVDPSDLLPKLPKASDLQPFPSEFILVYRGHTKMVRAVTVDPSGQFVASGSDDETVRIWEVVTGRCLRVFHVKGTINSMAWCPNVKLTLIVLAVFVRNVKQVTWHAKGDYFAAVMPDGGSSSVVVHQLSKLKFQVVNVSLFLRFYHRAFQYPFSKNKGFVQKIIFHPLRPYFFVATQRHIRIYNLVKQQMIKKLVANCKWISSMALHPKGKLIAVQCFHSAAVRSVAFHNRYPLFASVSDDGTATICHGMVYNDLMLNPLIVPVKVLRGHKVVNNFGILDCAFHPVQPWLFTCGADGTVRLYA